MTLEGWKQFAGGLVAFVIGLVLLYGQGDRIISSVFMAGWQQIPARLEHMHLHRREIGSRGKTTDYRLEVRYAYRWQGAQRQGWRYSLYDDDDSLAPDMHAQLKTVWQGDRMLTIYVDPANPDNAIVLRDLHQGELVSTLLLSVLAISGGAGLMWWGLR